MKYTFKRSVITDEISQDLEAAVELSMKYRLDGIELRSVWEKGPHELDACDIRKMKEILSDTGLEVCCISSPFYKCDLNSPGEIAEHMDILKRCIELAHNFGTKIIRGFTFWNKGDFEASLPQIIAMYEEPVKVLEKENILLGLEFDDHVLAHNSAKLVRVLDGVGSSYVRAVWDPGNDLYDPDGEVPYPDGYRIIQKYLAHMHLKDAKRMKNGSVTGAPVGEGEVDYVRHFRELIRSGYSGYVSLETHYRPFKEIAGELLALPKGSAFSYGGYEATEECLVKWERLMEKVLE